MERLKVLTEQFKRGCEFFNNELLFGGMSPYLQRKATEFEREVIAPFDAACKKATPEELEEAGVVLCPPGKGMNHANHLS